jgi:hypothetical protein
MINEHRRRTTPFALFHTKLKKLRKSIYYTIENQRARIGDTDMSVTIQPDLIVAFNQWPDRVHTQLDAVAARRRRHSVQKTPRRG